MNQFEELYYIDAAELTRKEDEEYHQKVSEFLLADINLRDNSEHFVNWNIIRFDELMAANEYSFGPSKLVNKDYFFPPNSSLSESAWWRPAGPDRGRVSVDRSKVMNRLETWRELGAHTL